MDARQKENTLTKQRSEAYGSSFRQNRFQLFKTMIEDIIAQQGHCKILDVGGEFDYWKPFLPLLQGMPIEVVITNIDDRSTGFADPRFSSKYANACDLSFCGSEAFDIVHSNSVIEHVGRWPEMKAMATEIRRVAKAYYVQTPYFWFPLEPHYRVIGYQWLPESWRARLHTWASVGYYKKAADFSEGMTFTQRAALLDKTQMKALFPEGKLISERVCGLTKSLIITRAAA